MKPKLKPLGRQTIVITGATSGIGLATARMAADRGARLVLVARGEPALEQLRTELERRGHEVIAVPADVATREDVERVARRAIEAFGGFDTWINCAATALYGTLEQVAIEDQRRLFDVDYWGVVHGSLAAARHLRERGGAIINVGSILNDRALVLQGPYAAAKHAVNAFTDALRMELGHDRAPVSVTIVKPATIDTPYMEHARDVTGSGGIHNVPPWYSPRVVARAILFACEHPRRSLYVGGGGAILPLIGALFPQLTNRIMERLSGPPRTSGAPGRPEMRDNLYASRPGAEQSSLRTQMVRRTSLLAEAQMHPGMALFMAALVIAGIVAAVGAGQARERSW